MSTKFQGLETISRCTIERLSDVAVEVYLHLCVPLYADDIVILEEYHVDLQDALHALLGYPNMLGLQVNTANTKVTVFFCKSKRTLRKESCFYYHSEKLEIVEDVVYIGVLFGFNYRL